MPARKRAAAPPRKKTSARKKTTRPKRSAPPRIKTPPPPREADPFAKKTGRRRTYFTGEFLAEAQRRVEQTSQSTTAIAGDFGMHHSVLSGLIKRQGWVRPESAGRRRGLSPVMRLAATVDGMVEAHPPAHSRESGNPALDESPQALGREALGPRFRGDERTERATHDTSAIDRLEAAVLKELSTVEKMRASLRAEPLRPMDAERTARTLSVLTETLAKLRRLRLGAQPQSGSGHDDYPADIDGFRNEFARRIRAFVASRTGGGGAAPAGPAGGRDPL